MWRRMVRELAAWASVVQGHRMALASRTWDSQVCLLVLPRVLLKRKRNILETLETPGTAGLLWGLAGDSERSRGLEMR